MFYRNIYYQNFSSIPNNTTGIHLWFLSFCAPRQSEQLNICQALKRLSCFFEQMINWSSLVLRLFNWNAGDSTWGFVIKSCLYQELNFKITWNHILVFAMYLFSIFRRPLIFSKIWINVFVRCFDSQNDSSFPLNQYLVASMSIKEIKGKRIRLPFGFSRLQDPSFLPILSFYDSLKFYVNYARPPSDKNWKTFLKTFSPFLMKTETTVFKWKSQSKDKNDVKDDKNRNCEKSSNSLFAVSSSQLISQLARGEFLCLVLLTRHNAWRWGLPGSDDSQVGLKAGEFAGNVNIFCWFLLPLFWRSFRFWKFYVQF